MSDNSLELNEIDLSCDECINVFNRLIETNDLKENPSQERVFHVELATDNKVLQYATSSS